MTFNILQDSTTGLQTTISATLADDSKVTDSKNAIFTVITSPDTSIAKYWGHMPETFTNSKGVEFKRPLLRAELSSTSNTTAYSLTGDGEVWFSTTNMAYLVQCDQMSTASASDLATLQSDHPNGELMTQFGLPVNSTSLVWIAGNVVTNAAHTGVMTQRINLYSGENTQASSQAALQLCRVEPRTLNITLTSSLPWDANKAGYQEKKGEKIPLTIDVTDDAGQPQAGVGIKFYRGASSFRNAPGSSIIDTLAESYTLLEPVSPASDAVTQKYSSSPTYWYGTTDSNGKVQLNVSQDNTTGLKTQFYAVIADNNVSTEGVGGIFTVLTSPDVDTAFRWGHMPETVEGPDGVTYTRPKLQSEVPSGVGFYNKNNEYWAHPTAVQAQTAGATGCDPTYQPLLSDLQALYNKYPNAELETAYGWPLSSGRN